MTSDGSARPNVVLLVLDSVRATALSTYGGDVPTPTLDALADRGTVFERAYSVGDNTAISHPVLFSGQYPTETGIVNSSHRYREFTDPVLATEFGEAGYDTCGAVCGGKLSGEFDFDRGFDDYFETGSDVPEYLSPSYLRAVLTDREMRRPLVNHFARTFWRGVDHTTGIQFDYLARKLDGKHPVFAFSNFLTAHTPYDPPRPYKEDATPELDRPRWFFLEHLLGVDERLDRDDVRLERLLQAQDTDGVARYLADPDWLSEAELDVLYDWYAASIRYLDHKLGDFLEGLADRGVLSETVVVVTADHGEHFGEQGLLRHGYSWFDECLHVPLIFAGPGVPEGQRREDFASLVDLFDTLCDLTGVDAPETTSGRSLFGDDPREHVYSEHGIKSGEAALSQFMSDDDQEVFNRGWKAVRTDDYTYVLFSDGSDAVYAGPDEREQSADEATREQLRATLFEGLPAEFKTGHGQESDIGEELRAQLRELGYVE